MARRFMAGMLPIERRTQINQSVIITSLTGQRYIVVFSEIEEHIQK